jgi:ubiquinone/menaquinone biosynthesis C-methylase UbiE
MSTIYQPFNAPESSHQHSLETLNLLYEYDDFMESVGTMADMGCGEGLDLEWWATRTTRDEQQRPLDIRCTGFDQIPRMTMARKYANVQYQRQDIEQELQSNKKFDVMWCHDAFQYVIDPFSTLRNWNSAINVNGMLIIIVPQMCVTEHREQAYDQRDYCYWSWTMVNLIHVLAVSGFDCAAGHFLKQPDDPWLHAAVYKSEHAPMDPRTTRWYDLIEKKLLPESAVASINRHGYLRQRDLVLPWLDKSLTWLGQH